MSFVVLILMTLVVAIAIVELGIILYLDIFDSTDDVLFLEIDELFRIFGFFFIILIGFELIETVEMYFKDNIIHAEVVLLVAVIAVSRKVILLDLEKYDNTVGLLLYFDSNHPNTYYKTDGFHSFASESTHNKIRLLVFECVCMCDYKEPKTTNSFSMCSLRTVITLFSIPKIM